jgi:hypothetical protein
VGWQLRVQRHEAAALSLRHLYKVSIVYLLMTERLSIDSCLARFWGGPETMFFVPHEFAQKRGRLLRRDSRGRVGRIRRKSDESNLCHGATGPTVPGLSPKPPVRDRVVLMVWPGKREQDVGVEQSRLHIASSAKSVRARLLGITGVSAAIWKTGKPFLREVAASARSPRRASCDKT